MRVIGFLHSLMNNPRFVAAFPQGFDVGYVRRNAREAAFSCALGLIMFAYLAAFLPYKHWGHATKSEPDIAPLISQAGANRPKAVRLLLARGASKYAKTNEGFTAFDFAAFNKNESMARLLWTRLSAISDSALKAAMDESDSRMTLTVCQFQLSRVPKQDPSPKDIFQTDLGVEPSPLSNQERLSRCREWVSRNQTAQRKSALPFYMTQSFY